jgi:hypothetical protein
MGWTTGFVFKMTQFFLPYRKETEAEDSPTSSSMLPGVGRKAISSRSEITIVWNNHSLLFTNVFCNVWQSYISRHKYVFTFYCSYP